MPLSRSSRVEVVGGPLDGQMVPYVGPVMREPIPRPLTGVEWLAETLPSLEDVRVEYREYRLYHWRTESGKTEPRYVFRDQ